MRPDGSVLVEKRLSQVDNHGLLGSILIKTNVKQNVYKTSFTIYSIYIIYINNFDDYGNDKNNEERLPGFYCLKLLYVYLNLNKPTYLEL